MNDILYDNDPEAIPLGDFEKAKTMDYDTDITDGEVLFFLGLHIDAGFSR